MESKADFVHHESCRWARLHKPQQSKSITFAYRGFTRLLRQAVAVSFHVNHGAGGFGLGPAIDHYPVVDEHAYPPFQLVNYVCRAMILFDEDVRQDNIKFTALKHTILEAFRRHISRFCFNGAVVPRAINIHNETLLHYISRLIEVSNMGLFFFFLFRW